MLTDSTATSYDVKDGTKYLHLRALAVLRRPLSPSSPSHRLMRASRLVKSYDSLAGLIRSISSVLLLVRLVDELEPIRVDDLMVNTSIF